jgi:hypothetical protein
MKAPFGRRAVYAITVYAIKCDFLLCLISFAADGFNQSRANRS